MAAGMNPLAMMAGATGGGDPSAQAAGAGMASTAMGALANRAQNPGQQLSQQSAQLQGADPSMVLRQLEQINQVLGVLFVKTFQTLPNIANQISATMKQLSRAIKEAQQGATTSEAVQGSEATSQPKPPIDFSAARVGTDSQPDMGAMAPAA